MHWRHFFLYLAFFYPSFAWAQLAKGPDHGTVLATALEVAPGRLKDTTNLADTSNYVFRGKVISLSKDRTVQLCFDTEHLRVAGAWVGAPLTYLSDRNMGPAIEGKMLFTTKPGPGWAKDNQWSDPRPDKEGPLPRAWAHYRGLYLHGDRVVLSYTVDDCAVLEMPSSTQVGDMLVVTRTLKLGPTKQSQALLVCDGKATLRDGIVEIGNLAIGFVGANAIWDLDSPGRVHLKLPASAEAQSLQIVHAVLPADKKIKDFTALLQSKVPALEPFTQGGPPRWSEIFETRGTLGASPRDPYVVDDIELPAKTPWQTSIRFSGLDFFADGRAALCTWDGDVWVVSGLDDKLAKVQWRRFAAGLQQPLGLRVINDVIHTAGRDQITRLHDLNGDGEADFFENFNNDPPLTLQRHEFVMDLQTDSAGNVYCCRSGHYIFTKKGINCAVHRLPPDGSKFEVIARGFREPNGMSIGPDGTITVADNEGNGVPQTPIYHLKPGANYGFTPGAGPKKTGAWQYLEKPIVWLPKTVDRSAGSQVWVTSDKWGPLTGKLLHTSYGHCALYSVLIDKQAEPWQGAVWKFPLAFQSGVMRARFHPRDGQLYVCGLRGWDTNATRDGQFSRIRYTGQPLPIPLGFRVVKSGLVVSFSHPLERKSAEDDENWAGTFTVSQAFNAAPKKEELAIESVKLSPDGKTAMVEVDQLRPVMNVTLEYRLKSAAGTPVTGTLHGTIHRVP